MHQAQNTALQPLDTGISLRRVCKADDNLRSRRLRRDVVDNPVHTLDLVRDPRRDLLQHGRRENEPACQLLAHLHLQLRSPVSSHEVLCGDRPEGDDLVVRPRISGNTDRLDRQQCHERLRDLVVQAGGSNLLDVNVVCVLQDGDLIARHLSEDSDGETRSREGVSSDELSGDAEQSAKGAHLV